MDHRVLNETLHDLILAVPGMDKWPEVDELFVDADQVVRLDWQLPGIGCEAVGGAATDALPAMAALACLQVSIILVDDMLDGEPDGAHHRLGIGRTANLALALQAAASLLVDQCPVPAERRAAAVQALNRMALATAAGQELDVRNLTGEENYWRVVRAKSTPFYGAGLEVGALLGGASRDAADALYHVGVLFGEAIQIYDDLEDAFQSPANSDWFQGRNNLLILYGLTADYEEKEQFLRYRAQADDPEALRRAQEILISSGGVGYCAFQLLQRHKAARDELAGLGLPSAARIESLLETQLRPFLRFLRSIDESLPEQFLAPIR